MRQRIDLGAETIAFVRQRVAEIVGENQEGYKLSPSLHKHRRKQRRKIICDARSHRENHTENHAENHTENVPENASEKYYFSVIDIVQVLTDSVNPRDYIKKMLRRVGSKGCAFLIYIITIFSAKAVFLL